MIPPELARTVVPVKETGSSRLIVPNSQLASHVVDEHLLSLLCLEEEEDKEEKEGVLV